MEVPEEVRPPRTNRTILVVALASVLSLVAGVLLSQFIISPAERAAATEPPEPGLITVPAEQRALSTDIVLRGDALYEDPVSVELDSSEAGGPAIVTGRVPEVGDEIGAGDVLIEITGRPVIVLPGELPAYRSLRWGSSGPDVEQLRSALLRLDHPAGQTGNDNYDWDLSHAVEALYAAVGYSAPQPEEGLEEALQAARDQLRQAEQDLVLAQAELNRAEPGENSYELATRDAAQAAVDEAIRARDNAWLDALTPMPDAEILFVDNLPRRVDSVAVSRGDTLTGEALSLSGAELQIRTSAPEDQAQVLEPGMEAVLSVGDQHIPAVIESLRQPSGSADSGEGESSGSPSPGRRELILLPEEITEEQRETLVGANIRVTIPLESTGGEVLAVPVAALTAGPGGETRVEVLHEQERTETITVQTGLSAEGYAEITGGDLQPGELVVVGRD